MIEWKQTVCFHSTIKWVHFSPFQVYESHVAMRAEKISFRQHCRFLYFGISVFLNMNIKAFTELV